MEFAGGVFGQFDLNIHQKPSLQFTEKKRLENDNVKRIFRQNQNCQTKNKING